MVAGILIVALVSLIFPVRHGESLKAARDEESWTDVAVRAGKVYLFVAGLVGLSWGLTAGRRLRKQDSRVAALLA